MRSSARVICALPLKFLNMGRHAFPDSAGYFFRGAAAVDDAETVCMLLRKGQVRLTDLAMKLARLVIHAGFVSGAAGITHPRASERGIEIQVDQKREVGREAVAGNAVEGEYGLGAQPAGIALIGERGIGETVA